MDSMHLRKTPTSTGNRNNYVAGSYWPPLIISVALLLLHASAAHAQPEASNWVFGDGAVLVFSPNPVAGVGAPVMNTQEGSAAISDQNGNLLFYTDGRTVWNRNHQQMPNGTGLKGGSSATQSAIIVPWPATDCHKYFVFTVDEQEPTTSSLPQVLSYSVVDMTAASGLGDVDAATKNTQLKASVSEKLTAVTDAAGSGYWVVAHGFNKTTSVVNSEFYAYHVSASGVTTTPVVSIGDTHTAGTGTSTSMGVPSSGQMKISPDGTMIACAVNTRFVEIRRFSTQLGTVGSLIANIDATQPPFNDPSVYGLEFSPDNLKLYISTLRAPSELFQFVISGLAHTSLGTGSSSGYDIGQLQLGPDGKIYVARDNKNTISVIDNPNGTGAASNFITGPTLAAGALCRLGLPTTIQGHFSCAGIAPNCPPRQISTTINGEPYCCTTDNDGPIDVNTGQFCCTKRCPPGSTLTVVNGVAFCCTVDPVTGILCCTRRD